MLDETPVRVHFSNPKELYDHPHSDVKLPFFTGERYYARWIGDNGQYFHTDGKSVIDAWRNPKKFNLDLKPLSKLQQMKPSAIFYAIAGWVEEWFHIVEKQNSRSGNTFKERELCTGPGCEYCKKKLTKVFGKKIYIVFSQSQWDGSMWIANERAHSRCKCGGRVFTSHYVCESCEEGLYDFASCCYSCDSENLTIDEENEEFNCDDCNTSWSMYPFNNAEFYKDVTSKTKCKCGHEGTPMPVQYCTNCGEDFDSYDLMDYQMKINATIKGKAKIIGITDMVVQEPNPKLFEAKYQDPDDEELGEKIAKANHLPVDLNKACAPMDNDKMAEVLQVGNPFSMGGNDDEYQSYSRNKSGDNGNGSDESTEETSDSDEDSKPARRPSKGPKVGRPGGKPKFRRPER